MKSVALADAKANLHLLVDEVRKSKNAVEIRKRDQPVAYLVDAETFKRLQGVEDSILALQLRQALKEERYDLEEVLAQLALGL